MSAVSSSKQGLKVFVCSTWEDLKAERTKVLEAIRQIRFQHDAMEYFGADPRQPIEKCLEEVRSSDVFLGIIGHRYGSIVEETGKSYTHMEYQEAMRHRLACLIYIKSDNVPILPKFMETNPESILKLRNLKDTLLKRHTVCPFSDENDLAVKVTADLASLTEGMTYRDRIAKPIDSLRSQVLEHIDSGLSEVGDKEFYLKEILENLSHLTRKHTATAPSVFLSYTHSDKTFARKLAQDLSNHGIKVWMDEGEIQPGDSLVETISSAIDKMDFFAIILSPESVNSDWVKRELNIAIYREISNREIQVIPILIEDCEIPTILRDRLFVDMSNEQSYRKSLSMLIRRLLGSLE